MNRRQYLAGAGAAVAGVGGVAGVRMANVRHYSPRDTVDESLPAGERIFEAARLLSVLDHRAVTRVTVLDDGTDADPYEMGRYRRQWQPSRRRYLLAYTTFAVAHEDVPPVAIFGPHTRLHYHEATRTDADLPLTTVAYFSPGTIVYDPTAETPDSPDDHPRVVDDGRIVRRRGLARSSGEGLTPHDYVLSADVDWTRLEEPDGSEASEATDGTVSYEVTGREEYAKVPPLSMVARAVHDDSRLVATLDRETGRLLRLEDHRVVDQPVGDEPEPRWFAYRVVTEFDRYGEATARMPDGPVPRPGPRAYLRERWLDLVRY